MFETPAYYGTRGISLLDHFTNVFFQNSGLYLHAQSLRSELNRVWPWSGNAPASRPANMKFLAFVKVEFYQPFFPLGLWVI